jgi:ATP/maltotriose-dependent transcriptional regulator MalT
MPQPPGSSAEAAAGGSDVLLATKLFVPRPQSSFVDRPRLVNQLDGGLARGVILICAPAGFGKTVLVAEWAETSKREIAWLSLDAGDNDPARFWGHATAALNEARPGISERIAPLLASPPPPSFEPLVAALINELAQPGKTDVLLVLDDYHEIDSEAVHASLTFLLEHRPSELRLVITSRADPPLPLARLRARGKLAELRAEDLRFTLEEAAALLRGSVGTDIALPDASVAALATRTEGWAAGLQLAALSLQRRSDVSHFVETFSGSHRYVLDYLTDEVLDRQPERVRSFLLETSVLDRLSGELCVALTGRTDSQETLEAIERANLFLVSLDDVRGWWRYHHLFADLLRMRLQQEQPERVPALHRAAASWYEQHGPADDAIHHALAAGDAVWAARLVEQHVDALFLREGTTLQRWLAALPAEVVGSRPRLLLTQARMTVLSGRLEAVEETLDAAERAFEDAGDEPYEPSVYRGESLVANIPAAIALQRGALAGLRGDADRAITLAHRALAELGEDEWMLESSARWLLAVAEWQLGRMPEAERGLSSSIAGWLANGEPTMVAIGCHHLGLVQRAQGRLDAALRTYQQVLEIAAAPGRPPLPAAGLAYVGMAEVSYQRGDLDAALGNITEGIALCRRFAYAPPLGTGLATLAWIRQVRGDEAGALEAIDEAGRVAPSPGVESLRNPVPTQRARLLLAQGDVAGAARWADERGLGPHDEVRYPREPEYLVLARLLLAQGLQDQAEGLLDRLHSVAAAQDRTGSIIEIQALRALALAAAGEEAGALVALAEVLSIAHPQGYVRVFADEGPLMKALLGRIVAAQRRDPGLARNVPINYLGRLMRAFEHGAAAGAPPTRRSGASVPGLVEALSERELDVLRLLAAGKRNQEIANELYVALDTVKKHVTHIFEKLGAANRTEATARARELGLLAGGTEPPASFQS